MRPRNSNPGKSGVSEIISHAGEKPKDLVRSAIRLSFDLLQPAKATMEAGNDCAVGGRSGGRVNCWPFFFGDGTPYIFLRPSFFLININESSEWQNYQQWSFRKQAMRRWQIARASPLIQCTTTWHTSKRSTGASCSSSTQGRETQTQYLTYHNA